MDGVQADYCLTDSASVAPKPRTLDHIHAAVVPISALTAWQALVERARLTKGQRVLIHGGAGANDRGVLRGSNGFRLLLQQHGLARQTAVAKASEAGDER